MFKSIIQPVWVGIALVSLALAPLAACGDDDDTGDDTNTTTDTGEATGTAADTAAAIAPDTAGPTGTDPTGAADEATDTGGEGTTASDPETSFTADDGPADTGPIDPGTPQPTWSDVVDYACGATDRFGLNMDATVKPDRYTRGVFIVDTRTEPGFALFAFWGDGRTDIDNPEVAMVQLDPRYLDPILATESLLIDEKSQSGFGLGVLFAPALCGFVGCDNLESPVRGPITGGYTGLTSARYGRCDRVSGVLDVRHVESDGRQFFDGVINAPVIDFQDFIEAYSEVLFEGKPGRVEEQVPTHTITLENAATSTAWYLRRGLRPEVSDAPFEVSKYASLTVTAASSSEPVPAILPCNYLCDGTRIDSAYDFLSPDDPTCVWNFAFTGDIPLEPEPIGTLCPLAPGESVLLARQPLAATYVEGADIRLSGGWWRCANPAAATPGDYDVTASFTTAAPEGFDPADGCQPILFDQFPTFQTATTRVTWTSPLTATDIVIKAQ